MAVAEGEQAPLDAPENYFDVALANAVLHVFNKQQCENFILRVGRLLKQKQGNFFGLCVGAKEAGEWKFQNEEVASRYLQSKDSLTELLYRAGFTKVEIREKEMERTKARPDLIAGKISLSFSATF